MIPVTNLFSPAYTAHDEWEAVFDELCDLDRFGPNWDGDGAKAVRQDLIQTAKRWLAGQRDDGSSPPGTIYPTAGGTVMLEWSGADGVVSAHVRVPGSVEVVIHPTGEKPRFVSIPVSSDQITDDLSEVNRGPSTASEGGEFCLAA